MPRTTVSSLSAVEEKVNTRQSESEPTTRMDVDRGQTDLKLSKSKPIEEHQAHESVVTVNPASAHDIDVKIGHISRDMETEEGTRPAAFQTDMSHVLTNLHHTPTFAQQGSYANVADTSASDSAQRIRARALFKKYGLDVELGSINEGYENDNNKNNNQMKEESYQSNYSSNIDFKNRVAEAAVSLDNKNNTDTKNTNSAREIRVERIRKPILIRIKRRCHHCRKVFNTGDYCEECDHQKCTDCPRSPLPGSITQRQDIADTHGREMQRTGTAAEGANKGVARVVTKWLDDMEPRVEGTSRTMKGCRQAQMHLDLITNRDSSHSPSVSVSDKKKKKKTKKRQKRDQKTDNGMGDSQKSNQSHLDIKTRSTSRMHGPTIVVSFSPERQHIPSSSSKTSFITKSGPKIKQSHEARTTGGNGSFNPVFQSEVCHACHETVIPTLTSICPKCQHVRCRDCPRSFSYDVQEVSEDTDAAAAATNAMTAIHYRRAQHWYQSPEETPLDEYAQYLQNLILAQYQHQRQRQRQRVYKKPRVRVRWACDLCFSVLDPKSSVCIGCGHERCKNCIRDPEKRTPRLPDPDVVQALEARLSSIMIHE